MRNTEENTQPEAVKKQDKETCGLNNSFIPALKESERFILFVSDKLGLEIKQNFVITINKASKNCSGYFMPNGHKEAFKSGAESIHNINLNTLYLKTSNPYEVLTHELAHYLNNIKGVRDCSSNQYHNKHFKSMAEKLLLIVEKGKRGFAYTSESDDFKKMVTEFKPNEEAFNIFQEVNKDKKKAGSRLKLFVCDCGFKVRCAKTDKSGREFKGVCLYCNSEFKESGAKNEK